MHLVRGHRKSSVQLEVLVKQRDCFSKDLAANSQNLRMAWTTTTAYRYGSMVVLCVVQERPASGAVTSLCPEEVAVDLDPQLCW